MAHEEYLMRLNMLEQRIQKVQEQLMIVEQQRAEISTLSNSLDKIKGKKDKEILAHIGRGIFIKSKIIDNDELIIDVGSKVFLKKSIDEGKEIIEKQVGELENVRGVLLEDLSKTKTEAEDIILEIERSREAGGGENREKKA